MYLKEIEIQGFKSLQIRPGLSSDQGVTAVVGPNGIWKIKHYRRVYGGL